jgi:hypothetical protein
VRGDAYPTKLKPVGEDVSEFVLEQSQHARSPFERLITPTEEVYPVNTPEVAPQLGVTAW